MRRRFGYRRLLVLLRREGFVVNHKRLFRIYREERLVVRRCGAQPALVFGPVDAVEAAARFAEFDPHHAGAARSGFGAAEWSEAQGPGYRLNGQTEMVGNINPPTAGAQPPAAGPASRARRAVITSIPVASINGLNVSETAVQLRR